MALCRPGDSVENCAAEWRYALRQRDREARALLLRRYRDAYQWLRDELTAVLSAAEQEGDVSPGRLFLQERYRALMAQAEDMMRSLGAETARDISAWQDEAFRAGLDSADEILRSAGVSFSFTAFPHDAFREIVGALADGTPIQQYLAERYSAEAMSALRDSITAGIVAGWNPKRVARAAAQKSMGLALSDALRIARTEMLRAYREAARIRYAEAGVREWVWVSARDSNTCPACLALHGQRFPVHTPQYGHPNCRCTMVPVVPGANMRIEPGERWFARQDFETQEKILGKAANAAYQAGQIKLRNYPVLRTKGAFRTYSARSLRDILGENNAREWIRFARDDTLYGALRYTVEWRGWLEKRLRRLGLELSSGWSGRIVDAINDRRAAAVKFNDCRIGINRQWWERATEAQRRHVALHELLHSYSAIGRAYAGMPGWEEGVVEHLAYILYRERYGAPSPLETGYRAYMDALTRIRIAVTHVGQLTPEDFYWRLLSVPLHERPELVYNLGMKARGDAWRPELLRDAFEILEKPIDEVVP